MRAREADRGVSTTLGYVLTLSITAVLVSVLLVGTGQYVDDQRSQVAERELSVLSDASPPAPRTSTGWSAPATARTPSA
ncbi:hypothetical protein [Halogeometricum sp. CBA1124]|uniref:DUF7266 family protein n=1 Tax=Halogeometricum sp. CBA1124 TaxID=2668071 RepID=UPI001E60687F|nr:hypothetical protein [Halogeometricum sp. CBA1124]